MQLDLRHATKNTDPLASFTYLPFNDFLHVQNGDVPCSGKRSVLLITVSTTDSNHISGTFRVLLSGIECNIYMPAFIFISRVLVHHSCRVVTITVCENKPPSNYFGWLLYAL
jgi:hypothetical protein